MYAWLLACGVSCVQRRDIGCVSFLGCEVQMWCGDSSVHSLSSFVVCVRVTDSRVAIARSAAIPRRRSNKAPSTTPRSFSCKTSPSSMRGRSLRCPSLILSLRKQKPVARIMLFASSLSTGGRNLSTPGCKFSLRQMLICMCEFTCSECIKSFSSMKLVILAHS